MIADNFIEPVTAYFDSIHTFVCSAVYFSSLIFEFSVLLLYRDFPLIVMYLLA